MGWATVDQWHVSTDPQITVTKSVDPRFCCDRGGRGGKRGGRDTWQQGAPSAPPPPSIPCPSSPPFFHFPPRMPTLVSQSASLPENLLLPSVCPVYNLPIHQRFPSMHPPPPPPHIPDPLPLPTAIQHTAHLNSCLISPSISPDMPRIG